MDVDYSVRERNVRSYPLFKERSNCYSRIRRSNRRINTDVAGMPANKRNIVIIDGRDNDRRTKRSGRRISRSSRISARDFLVERLRAKHDATRALDSFKRSPKRYMNYERSRPRTRVEPSVRKLAVETLPSLFSTAGTIPGRVVRMKSLASRYVLSSGSAWAYMYKYMRNFRKTNLREHFRAI